MGRRFTLSGGHDQRGSADATVRDHSGVRRWRDALIRIRDFALGLGSSALLWVTCEGLQTRTGHNSSVRLISMTGGTRWIRALIRRMLGQSLLSRAISAAINKRIEKTRQDYAALLFMRGMAHFGNDDRLKAEADLSEATRVGYRAAGAYFHLGWVRTYLANLEGAEDAYRTALTLHDHWPQLEVNLASVLLMRGDAENALPLLRHAIELDPRFAMAHQNLAAKYDRDRYVLQPLDLEKRDDCILYDALNRAGELAIHAGLGRRGGELFADALRTQRRAAREHALPADHLDALARIAPFDPDLPVRILPYEWVTQIGHIAMLDTYLKAALLGWTPRANYVLLAPRDKVSNPAYLDCWRSRLLVVEDQDLVTRLFPWQRYFGDCFNAVINPDDTGDAFTEFGARVHIEWDRTARGPLLHLDAVARSRGRVRLERLGLPEGAWFVTLHVREGGYHREHSTRSQSHRNASIMDYEAAIHEVVGRGGWVVRVGDRSMQPLPAMRNVIDYAVSREKSPEMDVYLCGDARLFIGTTSGLTNAVISFGTPCVLVNCLSNFAQLWPSSVTYCPKPFWSEPEERYLRLEEMLPDAFRDQIFDLRNLSGRGVTPVNNSPDDIAEVVAERLDEIISGKMMGTSASTRVAGILSRVVGGRPLFGNGRASEAFFARRGALFFGDADQGKSDQVPPESR